MGKSILNRRSLIKIFEREFEDCIIFLYDSMDENFVYKSDRFSELEEVFPEIRNRFNTADKNEKVINFSIESLHVIIENLLDDIHFGVCFTDENIDSTDIKKDEIIKLISFHKKDGMK